MKCTNNKQVVANKSTSIPIPVSTVQDTIKMYFVLKTETFAKLFMLVSCTGLFMYATLAFYTFHTAYSSISQLQKYEDNVPSLPAPGYKVKLDKYRSNLKYILVWTFNESNIMGAGHAPFIDQGCFYTNCYLTANKFIVEDVTKFEAIIFDVSILLKRRKYNFPDARSNQQKYIFHSSKSSDDTPVCSVSADNFFNWTWSYRFDSDVFAPFFEVKDLEGNVVAPRPVVNWNSNMTFLGDSEVEKFKHKKKAVAWIITKCVTRNDRMLMAKRLKRLFTANALDFDIFGCGNQECPQEGCLKALERDYYFYYAPEDSHAKDYVTSEVLIGYNNYAVPIVYGGADYTKFIPEGSYINVETSSPGDRLVALIQYIIRNPTVYYSFHRWRKHYTISETPKFNGLCEICKYINDENKFQSKSVKENFRKWWFTRPLYGRCIPKGAENLSEVLSYINESRRYGHGNHV